ncbi:MAG: Lrp/AsnC family transcriptional regulator [Hadesarchaea archaeon]|nr:MAG: Lrp/AsnC family transcriptional regulator [Hadesarchaea archaeon]
MKKGMKMPLAFVLIDAEAGKVQEIINSLKKIQGVTEAYGVTGPHDIVVKIQLQRFEEVAATVSQKIHKLGGVKNTLTMFTFERIP